MLRSCICETKRLVLTCFLADSNKKPKNTPRVSAYRKARGSQSLNGISSLAACRTSSSSTIPLTRCSTCKLATLSHSTSGGRWECALQGKKIQFLSLWLVSIVAYKIQLFYRLVAARMSEISSSI